MKRDLRLEYIDFCIVCNKRIRCGEYCNECGKEKKKIDQIYHLRKSQYESKLDGPFTMVKDSLPLSEGGFTPGSKFTHTDFRKMMIDRVISNWSIVKWNDELYFIHDGKLIKCQPDYYYTRSPKHGEWNLYTGLEQIGSGFKSADEALESVKAEKYIQYDTMKVVYD